MHEDAAFRSIQSLKQIAHTFGFGKRYQKKYWAEEIGPLCETCIRDLKKERDRDTSLGGSGSN